MAAQIFKGDMPCCIVIGWKVCWEMKLFCHERNQMFSTWVFAFRLKWHYIKITMCKHPTCNQALFRLHSEILPVPICKLLFLCKIPNCPLMKIETYRQASGNGHETINQRATAAATACTGMHLPNLSCSLISVCWLFCGFHPAKTGLFFCVR